MRVRESITSIGVLLVATACPANELLVRGPYLQLATPASVTVVWRTSESIQPVVRYGDSPDSLTESVPDDAIVRRVSVDVAAASAEHYGDTPLLYDEPYAHGLVRGAGDRDPSTAANRWQYEATIEGLSPGQRVYYAVCDADAPLAGGDAEHYAEALPPAGSETDLRVWVVGDSGTGGADQRRVFQAMQEYTASTDRKASLYMHLGDMAYGDGADEEFQRNFFDVYQPLLRNTVCWPTMGNHEGHTSRGVSQFGPYYDAYVLPTAGEAGGLPSGTEAYYSFVVAGIHFVCLDSHDLDRSAQGAMAKWLMADLEQADADWLIAFWHHPPYTKGSHDSDVERQLIEMREWMMPLLEDGGVDMVLSGHSHIYERSMLVDGAYTTPTTAEGVVLDDGDGRPDGDGPYRKSAGLTPHNGTIAIVAGHGGAGVSRKGTMPIMREIVVENGSLLLDIRGDELIGTMIDHRAEERDRFQLVKAGAVRHAPLENPWTPPEDPDAITEMTIWWEDSSSGACPPDWRVVDPAAGDVVVKPYPGEGFNYAAAESSGEDLLVVYDGYEGPLSEWETYLHFPAGATSPSGMIIGWDGTEEYYCFELSPSEQSARLVRVSAESREVVSNRELEVDYAKPIKVELEFVESIIEVQINDEFEYTINLDSPIPSGRVGIAVGSGGRLNFAGMTLEKDR